MKWFKRRGIFKEKSPWLRAMYLVGMPALILNILIVSGFLLFSHRIFRSVETADVKNKLKSGQGLILNEVDQIDILTTDYANWSALYEYAGNPEGEFILNNFDDNFQKILSLNMVIILNPRGEVIYSKTLNLRRTTISLIQFDVQALLQKYPELIFQKESEIEGVKGLVTLQDQLIMVSSHPLTTSRSQEEPGGTLIFGRFLDAGGNQRLTRLVTYSAIVESLNDRLTSSELKLAKYALTGDVPQAPAQSTKTQCAICHVITRGSPELAASHPIFATPVDSQTQGGYTLLYDLHHTPIAIFGIHIPREFNNLENKTTSLFLILILGLSMIASVVGIKITAANIASGQALDQEYRLLRAVIDNVPEQIYAHDVDGRFILNNARDAQIMGVENPEELIGKTDFDYYPLELASEFNRMEMRIIQTGEPLVDLEEAYIRLDGSRRWVVTTKTPLKDDAGQIKGIVGVSRDVSVRKQRELELEAIVTMIHALRSAETNADLLYMIYRQVIEMLQVHLGTLELIDPISGDAEVAYSFGFEPSIKGMRIPVNEGLNTYIRNSNKAFRENNLCENPKTLNYLLENGCKAVAGAPLIAEKELIGFLWIGRKTLITEDEMHLLSAIADIAASSIRRMNLHELTKKRYSQLLSLRQIDTSINSSKELETTIGVVLEQTLSQLEADAADVLLLFSPDSEFLENRYGKGFQTNTFDHQVFKMSESMAGVAARNKDLFFIQNLSELGKNHSLYKSAKKEGFISYFAVPLLVRDEIKGVMEIFFRREYIPNHEWKNFLETLAGQAAIAIEQVQLFKGLQQSNQDLIKAYDETIEGWVRALDLRDKETEGHSIRVCEMCVLMAAGMGINDDELVHIRRGALLHDIGKVGIPDHILLKPGKLTDDEWVVMRGHPVFAQKMLSPIDYLHPALDIPYCHHEKWDGSGYPRGLKGEEIPLAARIFAVIDVWDALTSDRPYRNAWTKEEALKNILEQSGSHFDSKAVEGFLEMMKLYPFDDK